MKDILIYLTIISFSLLFSCNKEPDEEKPDEETETEIKTVGMNAKIDGESWEANEYSAYVNNGVINITGDKDGETITITLLDDIEGNYSLSQNSDHSSAYIPYSHAVSYTSNGNAYAGGNVNIESINTNDTTITGTFEFDLYKAYSGDSVAITEGSFYKIKYKTSIPSQAEDSLSATVDGEDFTPTSISVSSYYGSISISATSGDEMLSLGIDASATPGTYPTSWGGSYNGSYYIGDNILTNDTGTIVITKHDKTKQRISGTFSYDASVLGGDLSVSVTNGSFAVSY